tara:strand:- start:3177 stop:3362 length:186 start_codon:yes stop_codon:yes gene_type:complete
METNDTQSQIRLIEKYELERLRKANSKFKLEIIELKQKLKEIYSVLTTNTTNTNNATTINY